MLWHKRQNIIGSHLCLLVLALALFGIAWWQSTDAAHAQTPPVREFTIGMSAQGRPITAVQVGDGPRKLVIVGDTHGGPEANTYTLTLQLVEHFRAFPEEVPPNVRLYLIPTINPDGLALGSRFDSLGVDLNRNMDTTLDACPENDWSRTVFGAYGVVSNTGGPFPESQLEARLTRNFLLDASGAIFLHSNAGLVFPAYCEHRPSIQMAKVYADAAGYLYQRYWTRYMISGAMADWASSMGIAAITPELLTATSSEFEQNLAGIRAVLAQPDELLPLPADHIENGVEVPALIWRYWYSHGGEPLFGLPLRPPERTAYGWAQTFSRARLELRPALADTAFLVQPAALNLELAALRSGDVPDAFTVMEQVEPPRYLQSVRLGSPTLFFEETGHGLKEAFLVYWQLYGGADVFGLPISDEYIGWAADGQMRPLQHFERATLAYYPEDDSVRPEPLGWQYLLLARVQEPHVLPQVR
jgi:predicted deacylase